MKAVIYSNKPLPELAGLAAKTFGRVPNKNIDLPKIDVPVVTDAQKDRHPLRSCHAPQGAAR